MDEIGLAFTSISAVCRSKAVKQDGTNVPEVMLRHFFHYFDLSQGTASVLGSPSSRSPWSPFKSSRQCSLRGQVRCQVKGLLKGCYGLRSFAHEVDCQEDTDVQYVT